MEKLNAEPDASQLLSDVRAILIDIWMGENIEIKGTYVVDSVPNTEYLQ